MNFLNIAYRASKEDINLLCEGLVAIRDLLRYIAKTAQCANTERLLDTSEDASTSKFIVPSQTTIDNYVIYFEPSLGVFELV